MNTEILVDASLNQEELGRLVFLLKQIYDVIKFKKLKSFTKDL